jgi:PAS domain S-box-containing protein
LHGPRCNSLDPKNAIEKRSRHLSHFGREAKPAIDTNLQPIYEGTAQGCNSHRNLRIASSNIGDSIMFAPARLMKSSTKVMRLEQPQPNEQQGFRHVISKLGDAVVILDARGLVKYLNPAAESLFMCPSRELLGKEIFGTRVFEIEQGQIGTETIYRMGEHALQGTRVVQTQVEILRRGVEDAIAEMRVSETEWEGEFAIIASLRDITSRVKAEEALRRSEAQLREQTRQLEQTLHQLKQTQAQLIQTEKMSSLGQLVAGIAHEINNPVNFISGNLNYANEYVQQLVRLVGLYQTYYPEPVDEIQAYTEEIELDFVSEDLPRLVSSMKIGTDRICEIVRSLKNFSRTDEAQRKSVNIHEGLQGTLLILQNRLKPKSGGRAIEAIEEYGHLPSVECYAGQLNQAFMNIISNAIDALEEDEQIAQPTISIRTELLDRTQSPDGDERSWISIRIRDNGPGMDEATRQKLFDPFFTTKPVGKGTGLGLSITYQIIVEKHGGQLECVSRRGEGTEFIITIPVSLKSERCARFSSAETTRSPKSDAPGRDSECYPYDLKAS